MRTALTILVIVALVLVAIGAVNNAVILDLDFLAAGWTGISLFWIAVALAAVVIAAGVAGAWAARGAAVAAQRRLEKELASTYKRLREAQAAADRTAVAPAEVGAGTEATALAPAPPGEAAGVSDEAAGVSEEAVAADVTAVTAAVAASSVAGWDDVAAAPDAGGREDVAAEVAAVLTAPAADEETARPADEDAVALEDPAATAAGAADIAGIDVAGRGEGGGGDEAPTAVVPPEDGAGDDTGAEVTAVTAVVPPADHGDVADERPAASAPESVPGEASADASGDAPAGSAPAP